MRPQTRQTGQQTRRAIRLMTALCALWLVLAAFMAGPPGTTVSAGTPEPADVTPGQPWQGDAPQRETVAQIMARPAPLPAFVPEPPLRLARSGAVPQNPASPMEGAFANGAALPARPAAPDYPGYVVNLPQTLGLNFTAATSDNALNPPFTMGAVGPSQFLIALSGRIRVFDKLSGTLGALDTTLDNFFNTVRSAQNTLYPRVRYDRFSGRWFVTAATTPGVPNRILIAVSDSGIISASTLWTFFFFQNDINGGNATCFAQSPSLGVDVNALYIGVGQLCSGFTNTDVYVVRKSSITGGGPIVVTPFRGLIVGNVGPLFPQGVDNADSAASEGYFIGTDNAAFGRLVIRRITTPGGTPSISGNLLLNVLATSLPLNVPHQGNANGTQGFLDAVDDRLINAQMRNGRLWTAHQIAVNASGAASGPNDRTAIRWYEIRDLTSSPVLVQAGTIFDNVANNPRFYWMGSIAVSGQGHVVVGMSRAGATSFVDAAAAGRLASDAPGTMGSVLAYTISNASYNPAFDTGATLGKRRWGEYSFTSLDPCDDMSMWTIQQFVPVQDKWGLRVVRLIAPPPANISSISPSIIPVGKPAIKIAVNGASVGGSGFYDPGAGFGCRLQAAFGGGVTVSSVAFNSPTSLTLTVSTLGASVGSKTLTLTNPDGQFVSAPNILNVAAGTQETIGVFRPASARFLLRNSNTTGPADISVTFGLFADLPVTGDWDGDGIDTVGLFRPSTAQFFLKNANSTAAPITHAFTFGQPNDLPLAGDWDGDGRDGIGVFRPSNGRIFLRNSLSTGFADFQMVYGIAGDVGVAGDWDGNGIDSPGVYRPSQSRYFLTNQVCNCTPATALAPFFGSSGDVPVVGDWNGDGVTTIGVFRASDGRTLLRNTNTTGPADISIVYGIGGDRPVAGNWAQVGGVLAPTFEPPRQ